MAFSEYPNFKLLTFEKPSALFNKQITDNEKCFTHSAKKAKFWFEKTSLDARKIRKPMIFSTSFPMFIDSLKSIRLYNWARKKNHRHFNTRVCSLKIWNYLVFCYDNPTTIELIWFYFEVFYLKFSCCLFMLIFFWGQEDHK